MDDELKAAILRHLTKEDILEIFDQQTVSNEEMTKPILSQERQFYLTRKIPGSIKRCNSCGQDMVNDEEHALKLLGGENIEL